MTHNRRMTLAARPEGEPGPEHFAMVEAPFAPLPPGKARMQTIYTSVDPAMRIRMRAGKSYIPPFAIGETVGTYSVGQIIESDCDTLPVGSFAWSFSGWETHPVVGRRSAFPIVPVGVPLSAYLGVLGFTGFTAWLGLEDIGRPKPGETLLVTAASGAVGSIAGQIGKLRGLRVVGVTSGAARCAMLKERLGFDAAIDRSAGDFSAQMDRACPDGVDIFFENVGGPMQAAILPRMRMGGRVIMCGMIAQYNDAAPEPGPNLMAVVTNRLRLEGFIASDSVDRLPGYQREAGAWVQSGQLLSDETIVAGLHNGPTAFRRLLGGDKLGKTVLQLAPDPFAPARALSSATP
ncbi:NADP-dependent oxidoreductase [Sphingobium cupriresistens]|uniref:2-alkenal reductase n=1 Tax=Sphingobium cupriresistens LL01 TaxID=1420583 RepID=A0A0J7XQE7_9SPHN|nr:NADP-dependent oxidoreductase [Sphingobium cupriresistens]KMS53283.1 2-alkenal reductase [Sphingobium cupriresistens LL01]